MHGRSILCPVIMRYFGIKPPRAAAATAASASRHRGVGRRLHYNTRALRPPGADIGDDLRRMVKRRGVDQRGDLLTTSAARRWRMAHYDGQPDQAANERRGFRRQITTGVKRIAVSRPRQTAPRPCGTSYWGERRAQYRPNLLR